MNAIVFGAAIMQMVSLAVVLLLGPITIDGKPRKPTTYGVWLLTVLVQVVMMVPVCGRIFRWW